MSIDPCSVRALTAAWVLALTTAAETAPPRKVRLEAEGLARRATIIGGGDLVIITTPDAKRMPLSGGRAVSFVPRAKGSAVEFVLPVARAGVYRIYIHTVFGPSCGIYDVMQGTRKVAWLNGSRDETVHMSRTRDCTNGVRSHRVLLRKGENRIRFEHQQSPRRGGNLVLDWLELVAHVPPKQTRKPDPYDTRIPANEKHGSELLANGGFEQFGAHHRFTKSKPGIEHWQFNSAIPQETECIVRDPAQAHTGTQTICLKPDPLEDYAILYQTFRAESGKRYRVSFYARGTGAIRVDFYQYGGTILQSDSQRTQNYLKLTDQWQRYSFVMAPSVSGKVNGVAIALHGVSGGAAYFDDVSVREVLGAR